MKAIIAICFSVMAFLAVGAPSMNDFERMTDSQLMDNLTNNDSSSCCASLMVLSLRFNNPEAPVILSPAPERASYPKDVTLPAGLLEKTVSLAKSGNDLKVRIAAVMALEMFKYRTNTTPVLTALLADPTCIIRIRASQGLIDFANDYHEPIPDTVVTTLISCLDSTNSPDAIWQAEESLGDLGARAKTSLPLLVKLKHSKSPQVREYAREATWKIEKGLTEQKN